MSQLTHHVVVSRHKKAVASYTADAVAVGTADANCSIVFTVEQCKAVLLAGEKNPAHLAFRNRYIHSPWPASRLDPHLVPVPGLLPSPGYAVC